MALKPKQVERICEGLASGVSLRSLCREIGVHEATVRCAVRANAEWFTQVARAREIGCDAIADECIEISDAHDLDPADRRVRIDTRLKLLGKWSQRYGDKVDHTLSGPDGAPIQIAHANISDLARSMREAAAGRLGDALPAILAAPAPSLTTSTTSTTSDDDLL